MIRYLQNKLQYKSKCENMFQGGMVNHNSQLKKVKAKFSSKSCVGG